MDDPRRRLIVKGFMTGRTLREMGRDLGITRERVRQLSKRWNLCAALPRRARADEREGVRTVAHRGRLDAARPEITALLDELAAETTVSFLSVTSGKHLGFEVGRFLAGGHCFCVHRIRGRPTTGLAPYLRYNGGYRCRRPGDYVIYLVPVGRRFVIPASAITTVSLTFAEHHDGKWAPYRDAWPWRRRARKAVR